FIERAPDAPRPTIHAHAFALPRKPRDPVVAVFGHEKRPVRRKRDRKWKPQLARRIAGRSHDPRESSVKRERLNSMVRRVGDMQDVWANLCCGMFA
ncbi:MAG: hypothetical protein R6X16_15765, partial [Anaerolineae bacterium]